MTPRLTLLHRCRTCGAEWSRPGSLRTADCSWCSSKKPPAGKVDMGGVLVRPVVLP